MGGFATTVLVRTRAPALRDAKMRLNRSSKFRVQGFGTFRVLGCGNPTPDGSLK